MGELQAAQQRQEVGTSGATGEKEREETELEEAASILAEALVIYYTDKGQETEAGELDLTESDWTMATAATPASSATTATSCRAETRFRS